VLKQQDSFGGLFINLPRLFFSIAGKQKLLSLTTYLRNRKQLATLPKWGICSIDQRCNHKMPIAIFQNILPA